MIEVTTQNEPEILPGNIPVTMPDLPLHLKINSDLQYKAISDQVRSKILNIVRHQPATAKQLADKLGASPGAIGHHLKVLEEAGLVQVIARRITRGIVSKYYTRTARFFTYDISPEITGQHSHSVDILNKALIELTEVEENATGEKKGVVGFPHTRLSSERREYYQEKLQNLLDEFLQEREDPAGEVYGLCLAYFPAPAYVQETLKPDSENDRLEIE